MNETGKNCLVGYDLVNSRHTVALPAGCSDFIKCTETQPLFTVAAGCPDNDLVKLWPFPVQSPWFEDWWEPVEGVII